jgi:hypothetical protein
MVLRLSPEGHGARHKDVRELEQAMLEKTDRDSDWI